MVHEQAVDIVTPSGMDFAAIGAAFATYFVLSFLWWGPIFGKKWAALHGMSMDESPNMTVPLLLQALGTLFLSYVLWTTMEVFSVTHLTDGTGLARGDLSLMNGLIGGFFVWLGFIVPVKLGMVAWEMKPWKLFWIDAGGHLVALLAMGLVFSLF